MKIFISKLRRKVETKLSESEKLIPELTFKLYDEKIIAESPIYEDLKKEREDQIMISYLLRSLLSND
jgi:hypothetical protein